MAHWERVQVSPDFAGLTRADRQGGSYLRYHPDLLASVSNTLGGEVLEYAADVSTSLGRLGERLRSNPLPILYSTMIRRAATGKHRKSALYQADDVLDLLEHGTEVTR